MLKKKGCGQTTRLHKIARRFKKFLETPEDFSYDTMPRNSVRIKFQSISTFGRVTVLAAVVIALICSSNLAAQQPANGITLDIGSKAPALDIETWISNRDGAFKPVTEFEDGKVYVIEFWATYCHYCRLGMPHLAALQKKHYDDGVQVIGVTFEGMERVNPFLQEGVQGIEDLTYEKLTSSYCLVSDPDGSTNSDYLEAAGLPGIPAAFIVGKTGLIEWFGNSYPAKLDGPLQAVVDGTWDREAFKKELQKKREEEAKLLVVEQELQIALGGVDQKLAMGDDAGVLKRLGELIDNDRFAPMKDQLLMIRGEVALGMNGPMALAAYKAATEAFAESPDALNQLAWTAVETVESGTAVQAESLAAALEAAQLGLKTKPKDPSLLDTVSHLHRLMGNLEKAIEAQQIAVDNAGELAHQLEPFLNQLKAEKAAQ